MSTLPFRATTIFSTMMTDIADIDLKGGHAPALKVSHGSRISDLHHSSVPRLEESVRSTRSGAGPSQTRRRSPPRRLRRISRSLERTRRRSPPLRSSLEPKLVTVKNWTFPHSWSLTIHRRKWGISQSRGPSLPREANADTREEPESEAKHHPAAEEVLVSSLGVNHWTSIKFAFLLSHYLGSGHWMLLVYSYWYCN